MYDAAFKTKAVELSKERANISELARELGITTGLLYKWRRSYETSVGRPVFPGGGNEALTAEERRIRELEKRLKDAELERDILKKAISIFSRVRSMKYRFIKEYEAVFPVEKTCEVLRVSSGSYYRYMMQPLSGRELRKKEIQRHIESIYFAKKQRYGSPRITVELQALGCPSSRVTVSRYMSELGLKARRTKKFKATTDSQHNCPVADNVLNRNFTAQSASRAWVSDITYIPATEGFLYLTAILDLFDRKVVGWSLGTRLHTEVTTLPAWRMAVRNRAVASGMIFHPDRGVQYAAHSFANTLESYSVIRSMSRK